MGVVACAARARARACPAVTPRKKGAQGSQCFVLAAIARVPRTRAHAGPPPTCADNDYARPKPLHRRTHRPLPHKRRSRIAGAAGQRHIQRCAGALADADERGLACKPGGLAYCARGAACGTAQAAALKPKLVLAAAQRKSHIVARQGLAITCVRPQPFLVCAYVEHVRVRLKYGFRAVAMMHVNVYDGNARHARLPQRVRRGRCGQVDELAFAGGRHGGRACHL